MSSRALTEWTTERVTRLRELYDAHKSIEGAGPGRRWRTTQLNRMLVMALCAEFQGYARDLHDEGTEEFVRQSSLLGPAQPTLFNPKHVSVIRPLLSTNRRLDKANPDVGGLGEDFGRFGSSWWIDLAGHDSRTPSRQDHLSRLMKARNGIAHADEAKIQELRDDGYPITLDTVRKWHSAMHGLAQTMDAVLAGHLQSVFGGSRPW